MDHSYGVVPVRFTENGPQVLLAKLHRLKYFAIPKGHRNPVETDIEAAVRELLEESGHRPTLFLDSAGRWTPHPQEAMALEPIRYRRAVMMGLFKRWKLVTFYVAQVECVDTIQDRSEVDYVEWFYLNEETAGLLRYQEHKQYFTETIAPLLQSLSP